MVVKKVLTFILGSLVYLVFSQRSLFAADSIKLGTFVPMTSTPIPTSHVILPTDTPEPNAPTSTNAPHRPTNTPAPHSTPPPRDPCPYRYPPNDLIEKDWAKIAIALFQGWDPNHLTDEQEAFRETQVWEFNDKVSRRLFNPSWLYTKGMVRLSIAHGFGLDKKEELYNTFAPLSCEEKTQKVASYLESPLFFYPPADMHISLSLPDTVIIPPYYPKPDEGLFQLYIQKDGMIQFTNGLRSPYLSYDNPETSNLDKPESGRILSYANLTYDLQSLAYDAGLNNKETPFFADYFRQRLPKAEYYVATLLKEDQAEKFMPWNIDPVPDTQIRLLFTFQPLLKKPGNIVTQDFHKLKRVGFTVLDFAGVVLY